MNNTPPPFRPPTTDNTTAQWFDSIGMATPPTPQPPKHSLKKRFILVACAVLLLAAGSGVAMFFLNKSPACLSTADYTRLTGTTTTEPLSPTEGFYADYVTFQAGSSKYDNSGEHGESLIRKIANFHSSLDKNTSILITIKGNYFDPSVSGRTEERIAAVRTSLIGDGVPESILKTTSPSYVEPEEPSSEPDEIIIAISSATSCQ